MKYLLIISFFFTTVAAYAQDLNARVQVQAPQLANSNQRILDILQTSIQDFLNGRRWTPDALQTEERIDCNFVITIVEWDGSSNFKAEAQIQSNRPIFNTTYNSTMLNISDREFGFSYAEGQALDYSDENYISNLGSLLAFYAYVITGMDYDSFSPMGGTPYYQRAQMVLNNAQVSPNSGWKAFESLRNRFWLNENLLNKSYDPIRAGLYQYHRQGLDIMATDPAAAREAISNVLTKLQEIDPQKQGAMLNQIFFSAKSDELVQILSGADNREKARAYNILSKVDPANSLKYEVLRTSR